VQLDRLNVQHQDQVAWAPSFAVARSYADQAERAGDLEGDLLAQVHTFLDRAERFTSGPRARAAKASLFALSQTLKEFPELADLAAAIAALSEAQ
jgi:hypothetical protein